jgi:hypothetical protein
MRSTICAALLMMLFSQLGHSQSAFYRSAVANAESYHFKQALPRFQLLLKEDSLADQSLEYASICYSRVGFTLSNESTKLNYYKMADYLASKAIRLRPNSAQAHYAKALALGRMNENASSKEKIANSKKIKR